MEASLVWWRLSWCLFTSSSAFSRFTSHSLILRMIKAVWSAIKSSSEFSSYSPNLTTLRNLTVMSCCWIIHIHVVLCHVSQSYLKTNLWIILIRFITSWMIWMWLLFDHTVSTKKHLMADFTRNTTEVSKLNVLGSTNVRRGRISFLARFMNVNKKYFEQ